MKAIILVFLAISTFAFAWEENPNWKPHKTGYVRNTKALRKYVIIKVPKDLPATFDWRTVFPLSPVKDQGDCGSCYAFGTTAALENELRIFQFSKDILSEQEIVSCDHHNSGCGGGDFANAYQKDPGQSLESEFPYKAANLRCIKNLSHKWKIANWGYVGARGRNPTVDELKAAIYQHGVIPVTVTATDAMMRYKSGVFDYNAHGGTNHIVALVGWGDGYWIMRNSWGADWGLGGYMNIKIGVSRIGEEATFVSLARKP